ncbi:MAG: acylneuraminate cytidylyltransferase family protein [Bacteroidetes bacterium]|nr:acylneuraminate cytidylyltransferase family protein [Bacteroidota bacterium]
MLTIIPARGGSKGVPRKNIKILGNKPLIAYTIEAAIQSKSVGRLIVSTDDKEIADISIQYGGEVPFLRPAEFASDRAKAIEVVKHTLLEMEKLDNKRYSTIVYLEPPSPFRISEDIDQCVELFFEHNPGSVVSVFEANQFHPILMKQIASGALKPIWKDEPEGVPRQLYHPKSYMRNGAVYVLRRTNIVNNKFYGDPIIPYIMPEERSICIDSMLDWYAAEAMLVAQSKSQN